MTAHALRLAGIAYRCGATHILNGVDLAVASGERHALIGPNGAGKSTLFNVIGGALRPEAGSVWLDGVEMTGRSASALARAGLGRSFQTTRVFSRLSVLENVRCAVWCGMVAARGGDDAFGLFGKWGLWWRRSREIDERAWQVLADLDLERAALMPAGALEYGAQRRLALGLAWASGARTLLLDEPTAGMNREEAGRTIEWLRQASAGKTLIVIEHDMDIVFSLADRVSVLVQGRVLATGSAPEIRADERVRAAYLGSSPDEETP